MRGLQGCTRIYEFPKALGTLLSITSLDVSSNKQTHFRPPVLALILQLEKFNAEEKEWLLQPEGYRLTELELLKAYVREEQRHC